MTRRPAPHHPRPAAFLRRVCTMLIMLCGFAIVPSAASDVAPRVVDLPTRSGVTQRFLYLPSPAARAVAILFAGGHGGLGIDDRGEFAWGAGNFLVRSRTLFVEHGLAVAVIDKPSDRSDLSGARQTPEHVADVRAVMAWLRKETKLPVWLVGTSRGTQSVAYLATVMTADPDAPDGIVLTSTILSDSTGRAVPEMALERITQPVLVAHHEADGCKKCLARDLPLLMDKLAAHPRKALMLFDGGQSKGDPCEARAYHGFNGLEQDVVAGIARWILATP